MSVETERSTSFDDELMMEKGHHPSNIEVLTKHQIRIEFLSGRGCIVSVGCKLIAFEDNQKAMEALNAYVANPHEESKKWNEIFNK